MNLILAIKAENLLRTLPPREVTVMQAAAAAPHLVSISAGGDARLQLSNPVLATSLAMRLSVPQILTTPSTGAATETNRCPSCAEFHVNPHLNNQTTR